MALPVQSITPARFDQLMENGYRRSGAYFYNTQCPNCRACQPIRLDVTQFEFSRTHRRTLQRAAELQIQWNYAIVDQSRVTLFNKHRLGRNLSRDDAEIDRVGYEDFLLSSPVLTLELCIWLGSKLISVSITDVGAKSISAVYCCFDPDFSNYSLGTLSVLQQIQLARKKELKWLYLGFFVADNQHLSYKANYRPHQRRIDGVWRDFE